MKKTNTLTRLTIEKFRNVAPTTLEFRPGINVLLGRNATGKTTLLRLLSMLLDVPGEPLQDEPLSASWRVMGRILDFEQTTSRVRVEAPALPLEPGGTPERGSLPGLQYSGALRFEQDGDEVLRAELLPTELVLHHAGSSTREARHSSSPPITSIIASLWRNQGEASLELTSKLLHSRIRTSGRLDEGLDRFNETNRLNPEPDRHTARLSNLKLFFKRAGEEVSHEELSHGQKRLLAFFAHVDASPDLVISDELANGLHHEWISVCLDEIGERQAILTSQNPLLLDFLRFGGIEEVRRTFILCERMGSAANPRLIWRNLSEDEAGSFFLAYRTGLQRVSDILRTQGLE
ncbi:AAA family ATPase [Corallococcus macrosporus]|uniref:AAA family ATPase n=1 Tax=Corallococcus macrosporus TaxID=35 RepID=A0ABS3DF71_9BACT|nr:AAA family ATPase [Corallococcus macrosporus]MBN8229891.1 AAA family ATPase [Corallococcus macrosporus]